MASAAEDLAKKNRDWALQTGQPIMDQTGSDASNSLNAGNYYGDQAGGYYSDQVDNGGYSQGTRDAILGRDAQGGVPGLNDLGGTDGSNYLTEGEQAGIKGNPNDPLGYLHSDTVGQYMQQGGQAQDTAVAGEKDALGNAVDPTALRMSARYGSDLTGQVGDTSSALDTITGNPNLGLSDGFQDKYNLSPQAQQDIIDKAGRTVGNQNQGAIEAMQRQQAAAGVGPMGQAAREARMNRDSAVNSADAMTDARIAANSEAARRLQTGEGMRLGAAQNQEQQQAQAKEYSGAQGVNALENIEGTRIGAEQGLSDRQLQAATEGGRQDVANKQRETATNIGAVENVRDAEVGAHTTADQTAAGRATTLATNRQGINQQNYGRGMTANTALSQRYGTIADNTNTQKNIAAAGLTGQEQIRTGNANTERGQQIQTMGQTEAATGNAANTVGQAQNQPGTAERIFDTVVGGAATAAKAFEDGGIASHPTDAIVGESGPEMVVPMNPNTDNVDHDAWMKELLQKAAQQGGPTQGMEDGGVVTKPTDVNLAEGGNPEMVTPVPHGDGPPAPAADQPDTSGAGNDPTAGLLGQSGLPQTNHYGLGGQIPGSPPPQVATASQPPPPNPNANAGADSMLAGLSSRYGAAAQPPPGAPSTLGALSSSAPQPQTTSPPPQAQPWGPSAFGDWTTPQAQDRYRAQAAQPPPGPPPQAPSPQGQDFNARTAAASGRLQAAMPRYGSYPPPATPSGRPGYLGARAPGQSMAAPPPATPMGKPGYLGARPQPQQPLPQQTQQQPGMGGTLVTQPTRARLGQNGPEAVIPLNQKQNSKMRPGLFSGGRYGAAA